MDQAKAIFVVGILLIAVEWGIYGIASVVLGFISVTGPDRVAMSLLTGLACLIAAGVAFWDQNKSS